MYPRVDTALKMSTRRTPGDEGGRCVRMDDDLTTFIVPKAEKIQEP
jgi:hypothetical protein